MSILRNGILTIAATAAAIAGGAVSAHHSTAMFDMQKSVTLDGTVKEFQWTNPHTWIVFEVPNGSGGTDEYGIEGMSPNYLARTGWDKHTLSSGDKVQLVIHPLRDGRKGGFDVSVKKPDGTLMYNLPHGP
jgi:Family of unknown function (DUF6152)